MATFICYMFYKHTVLAVGDIFFAHQITFPGPGFWERCCGVMPSPMFLLGSKTVIFW